MFSPKPVTPLRRRSESDRRGVSIQPDNGRGQSSPNQECLNLDILVDAKQQTQNRSHFKECMKKKAIMNQRILQNLDIFGQSSVFFQIISFYLPISVLFFFGRNLGTDV